jgi:hypothetical protein
MVYLKAVQEAATYLWGGMLTAITAAVGCFVIGR